MLYQLLAAAWALTLFIGGAIFLFTVAVAISVGADAFSQWFIWVGLIAPPLALRFLSWALRRTDPKRE